MKIKILIVLLYVFVLQLYSQDSRYGYYLPPNQTIRLFIVFAEMINDPSDQGYQWGWTPGQMPDNPEDFVDHEFINEQSIHGELTKFFYQASLGNYIFLGDYYDELVQIDWNTKTSSYGEDDVVNYVNNLPGTDITTANGLSVNDDFDLWTPTSYLYQKTQNDDDKIDYLVIIWRTNHALGSSDNSGRTYYSGIGEQLKSNTDCNAYTLIQDYHGDCWSAIKHEFSHMLLGGNNFHSGGAGAGTGHFLSDVGGYSLLSLNNSSLKCINGWDRDRLGWKHNNNSYYISARKPSDYTEVETNLTYGQSFPEGIDEFILRDFITYGDAIRIKLPYLKTQNSSAKEQYLWIENHQLLSGNIDERSCMSPGIYFNIQIGNDNRATTGNSRTNYISPLIGFGNFDFSYETYQTSEYKIISDDLLENPFSGYNFSMRMAFNYIDPSLGLIDNIYNNEWIVPAAVEINGALMSSSSFCYYTYPNFGSIYDSFTEGDKLGLSTNPSSTPLLTYLVDNRISNYSGNTTPNYDDNRHVYLNGLSVEIVEELANGDVKVKVKWNDFDITQDRRWCGPIVLNENVYVKDGSTITFDQGLTPTRPTDPITYDGKKVFADPTILTCLDGSYFKLETGSSTELKNSSAFILESGSELELMSNSSIIVKSGSSLHIKNGADLSINMDGNIVIEDGGYLCIESGASINLADFNSLIKLEDGFQLGVNSNVISSSPTCQSLESISFTGDGNILDFSTDIVYIQNETIQNNRYFGGKEIRIGESVTDPPYGIVKIENGAIVTFEVTDNLTIYGGTEFEAGSTVTIISD